MFQGTAVCLYPVILFDLLGKEAFDKAFGLLIAFTSVAFFTAGPLSGK